MNINRAIQLVVGATLAATLSGGYALAATSSSTPRPAGVPTSVDTTQPATPNQCILLNRGDYNACNVGNNGRGDLPYKPVN